MLSLKPFFVVAIFSLSWSGGASAFRVCNIENSHAYSASTQYAVGEIAFDRATGMADGTETTYNYSNREDEGFTHCHVTYEFSGIFESASGTLVLDAQRTNHSDICPQDLLPLSIRLPGSISCK